MTRREPNSLWEQALQEQEEFAVEVRRTITTTVTVTAKNPLSAAKIVDNTSFRLPPEQDWDRLGGWTYRVRNSAGEQLYKGDVQELT